MELNGHSAYPPPDHTSILVNISGQMGEMRGSLRSLETMTVDISHRLRSIERQPSMPQRPPPRPLSDYVTMVAGIVIVLAAAAGKVTWSEVMPSLLGLAGR